MTNMYRTILLVLPALLLAACADDVTPPAEPADTLAGQPVRFTATGLTVTPAGVAQTKADGTETDFPAEGSTITVYMTGNGESQQANYTYSTANGWTSDAPLLWPDTQNEYTFTAISPAGTDAEITLPAEWTAENMPRYEEIRATAEAVTTKAKDNLALTLHHPLVKVQVVSTSGQPVYLTDAPMAGTLDLQGGCDDGITKGTVTLHSADDMIYEGYVLPSKSEFGFLADNVYTVDAALMAGTVVTTCDDTEAALINCRRPGFLREVWPKDNPAKVVITGTLSIVDMATISDHKDYIVNLYVMGGIAEKEVWNYCKKDDVTLLQSVYLAEATSIENNFRYCTELTTVSLPKAKSIGNSAFNGCTKLTSVSLPEAESIGNSAFNGCTKLTSVSLPEAESIEMRAFETCSKLTSICLSKDASIEASAFHNCDKLTTLFLSNCTDTEFDASKYNNNPNYGNHTWQTIHYGYQGTGDYLDPANYNYTYPTN